MRTLLTPVILLLFISSIKAREIQRAHRYADTTGAWYYSEFVPRVAFTQGWRSMLDASVALRVERMKKISFKSHSITAGAEWNFGIRKPLIGYKAGYTFVHEIFDFTGYSIGMNAVYFTDHAKGGWYLQPQVAYELLELFELMAQFNVPLQQTAINYRVNTFSAGIRVWWR